MALKQLMLTRERKEKTALLETIEKEQEALREQREAWKLRESSAEKALEELEGKPDATEEERKAFDDEAAEIEKEDGELREKEEDAQNRAEAARSRIGEIDKELDDIKERLEKGAEKKREEKSADNHNESEVFIGMNKRERIVELVKREDVKGFLENVKGLRERGVSGADLTIPQVMLPLISEAAGQYSVLEKHLDVSNVTGDAVQNILANVPEAVWTEAKDWIKELELKVYQMKTYGHKVSGFIPLHISDMEDSAENLAAIVIDALGKGIGLAKDKAVLYGTGVNMPVGIMTRLAATAQPAWWATQWAGEDAPAFKNLSATNIGAVSAAGVAGLDLMQEMFAVLGGVKRVYGTGNEGKFWAMSTSTWAYLQGQLLSFNAAGAIVSAANSQMPVIGGSVEKLDFIPDGVVVGGYGGNYKWINRRGVKISVGDQVRFLQDQILYKGTARADGAPMAGEAFAAFNIKSTAKPTASMNFNAGTVSREEEVLGNEAEG